MAKVYKGKCFCCGNEYAKRGMTRHLKNCKELKKKLQQDKSGEIPYLMMRIQGKYAKAFFLYLDIKAETTLEQLDQFLRDIWLECCGHLSAFKIDGYNYIFPSEHSGQNHSDLRIMDVMSRDTTIEYQYDFGSTTALEIDVLDIRKGADRKHMIEVLARNLMPDIKCDECGGKADWLSRDYDGYLFYYCDDCIEENESEFGSLPIVNSPRMGVCGYTGPAEENKDLRKW